MASKIQEVRRARLQELVDQYGASGLAKRLDHSGPSYIGQLLSGRRPMTEKTARAIEEKLGLTVRALDALPGEDAPFTNSDNAMVAASIRALGDALEETSTQIPPQKFAELVALIYEKAARAGRVDVEHVRRLLKLVK